MNKYVLIVAGGSGTRMGTSEPKQFLLLQGKPVLMHTLQAFYSALPDAELVLVLPVTEQNRWEELCRQYSFTIPHRVVEGGSSRFHSVQNGLEAISAAEGLVAVHDGVRPLVTASIILNSFLEAESRGSAVAAVLAKDSIRRVGKQGASVSLPRDELRLVQTPQTFRLSLLRDAYMKAAGNDFTDDASVLEASGHSVHLIEGSYRNIKITTPEDLQIASALLGDLA